jgi:diacylglycerol kinase (ATP)
MLLRLQTSIHHHRYVAAETIRSAAQLRAANTQSAECNGTQVAVLPLGTGNDLARVLNWGGGYEGEPLSPILTKIANASVHLVDRWNLSVYPATLTDAFASSLPTDATSSSTAEFEESDMPRKDVIMNNYCSFGVDAKVALQFHDLRTQSPELCSTRLGNKIWYALNGVRAIFDDLPFIDENLQLIVCYRACVCQPVIVSVTVSLMQHCYLIQVDGELIVLPKQIEGLIILNVASYAGGSDLWGTAVENVCAAIDAGGGDAMACLLVVVGCCSIKNRRSTTNCSKW